MFCFCSCLRWYLRTNVKADYVVFPQSHRLYFCIFYFSPSFALRNRVVGQEGRFFALRAWVGNVGGGISRWWWLLLMLPLLQLGGGCELVVIIACCCCCIALLFCFMFLSYV